MIRTIIIEGVDRTGKDSVRHEIVKQSEGKIVVICRAYVSQIAYGRIYNKKLNEQEYFDLITVTKQIGFEYILLTATDEELHKRFVLTNEPMIDIKRNKEVFIDLANELNVKIIDTTNRTVESIAKEIINR